MLAFKQMLVCAPWARAGVGASAGCMQLLCLSLMVTMPYSSQVLAVAEEWDYTHRWLSTVKELLVLLGCSTVLSLQPWHACHICACMQLLILLACSLVMTITATAVHCMHYTGNQQLHM
jgi:hypothetical protein